MRVCRNAKFRHALLSCVRVSKMQGAEIEDEGSVLTYITKSEIEGQRSSLLIMTQRLLVFTSIDLYAKVFSYKFESAYTTSIFVFQ